MVDSFYRNANTSLETGKRIPPRIRTCIGCGCNIARASSAKRCGPCASDKIDADKVAKLAQLRAARAAMVQS